MDPSSSIKQLKAKIEELERISMTDQHLSFGCKPLKDSLSLHSYGIQEGSVIDLNIRLRGGSDPKVHPKTKLPYDEILSPSAKYRELSLDGALEEVQSSRNILPKGCESIEKLQEAFKLRSKERVEKADNNGVHTLGTHKRNVGPFS